MILFINDKYLLNDALSYYNTRQVNVYNLSSAIPGYYTLDGLINNMSQLFTIPMNEIDTVEFDKVYANALINEPYRFADLMRIVSGTYEGNVVIVLVYNDPYRDAIMESLIKLIQQRYYINPWIIKDIEDLDCVTEDSPYAYGLMAYEEDLKRIRHLYSTGFIGDAVLAQFSKEY